MAVDEAKSKSKSKSDTPKTGKTLKITLVRSLIGRPEKQRRIAKSLGLRRSNHTVIQADTPIIQGMIRKISHLLTVETA